MATMPANAARGDDHKTVVLARVMIGSRRLPDGRAEDRRAISAPDQIRLFPRPAFIHAFEPVVDKRYRAVPSNGAKEQTVRG
jgi:hypothetical protein